MVVNIEEALKIKIDIEMIYGTCFEKDLLYEVVLLVIEKYCYDINIGNVMLAVVPIDYLPNKSSGRIEGKKILLSYQLLKDISINNRYYNADLKLSLAELERNIKSQESMLVFKSTIFHELVHLSRKELIPILYEAVEKYWDDDICLAMAAQYWVEYDAHLISNRLESLIVSKQFCESFISFDWKSNQDGYWYLLKCLSYFITRLRLLEENNIHLDINKIKNKNIVKLIEKVQCESLKLELLIPFNDLSHIGGLKLIFDEMYEEIKL